MINALLGVVLVVGVVTLAIAIGAWRNQRRSAELGESRYELLRDQQDRLELLREERRTLLEELKRESQDHRQLTAYLEQTDPRLAENLERTLQARVDSEREVERLEQQYQRVTEALGNERRGNQEISRRAEGLEREQTEASEVQQETERLRQDHQGLTEELERERVEARRRSEQQAHELARLERELQRSQSRAAAGNQGSKPRAILSRRRSPLLVVGLFLGGLILWFVSLAVALSMLTP